MAIINQNIQSQICELNEYSKVNIICPICKSKKELKFPKSVINKSRQLTTISIPKNFICEHHFQAFIDKNFTVRGYQKVDFDFAYDLIKKKKTKKVFDDNKLFDNLILEGNYVEYKTNNTNSSNKKKNTLFITEEVINSQKKGKNIENSVLLNNSNRKKIKTLKEIYEEFWEFIDDDNNDFKEFIQKDPRREKL
ncbi:MAG: hypothetical protein ACFFBW_11795 [Promethearchaeota archaeon]